MNISSSRNNINYEVTGLKLLTLHCLLRNKRNVVLVNPTVSCKILCSFLLQLYEEGVQQRRGCGRGNDATEYCDGQKAKSELFNTGIITMQGRL